MMTWRRTRTLPRKHLFLPNEFKEDGAVAAEQNKKRGPRTPEGKQRSRRNATRDGVLANTPVLPLVENEQDWQRLRQDVLDWFGLEGEFQESLGERVAMLIWRLKRAGAHGDGGRTPLPAG